MPQPSTTSWTLEKDSVTLAKFCCWDPPLRITNFLNPIHPPMELTRLQTRLLSPIFLVSDRLLPSAFLLTSRQSITSFHLQQFPVQLIDILIILLMALDLHSHCRVTKLPSRHSITRILPSITQALIFQRQMRPVKVLQLVMLDRKVQL